MEVVPLSAAEKPTTTKQTWATTVNGSKLVTSSNDESKNNNDNIKVSDVDSLPEKCTDNVKDDVKIIGGSSKEDDDGKAKEPSLKTRIAKSINPVSTKIGHAFNFMHSFYFDIFLRDMI